MKTLSCSACRQPLQDELLEGMEVSSCVRCDRTWVDAFALENWIRQGLLERFDFGKMHLDRVLSKGSDVASGEPCPRCSSATQVSDGDGPGLTWCPSCRFVALPEGGLSALMPVRKRWNHATAQSRAGGLLFGAILFGTEFGAAILLWILWVEVLSGVWDLTRGAVRRFLRQEQPG